MAFRLVQPRPSRNQGAHTASGIRLGKSAAKLSETKCHWRCTPVWPRCKVQAKRCWLWVSSLRCARYDHIICAATTLNFGRVNMVFVLQTSSLRWIAACVNRYRCDLRLCGLGITELVVKLCEDTYDCQNGVGKKKRWHVKSNIADDLVRFECGTGVNEATAVRVELDTICRFDQIWKIPGVHCQLVGVIFGVCSVCSVPVESKEDWRKNDTIPAAPDRTGITCIISQTISNHGFLTPVGLKHAWRCRIQATTVSIGKRQRSQHKQKKNICTSGCADTMSRSRERVFRRLAAPVNLHQSLALDLESLWDAFRKCYLLCPCQTLRRGHMAHYSC